MNIWDRYKRWVTDSKTTSTWTISGDLINEDMYWDGRLWFVPTGIRVQWVQHRYLEDETKYSPQDFSFMAINGFNTSETYISRRFYNLKDVPDRFLSYTDPDYWRNSDIDK